MKLQRNSTPSKSFIRKTLELLMVSILSASVAFFIFNKLQKSDGYKSTAENSALTSYGNAARAQMVSGQVFDAAMEDRFISAAESSVHAVVHVKVKGEVESYYANPLYEFFYGQPMKRTQPVLNYGSGVIISGNGYIVTNNHVIENSSQIEVVLNDKQQYDAKLIGKDPSTDLAVLKIEAKDLPFLPFGNSDSLRIGQWVMAVGNPFNLTSTVTAGIVSAKGRNLDILKDKYRIESFIQTDAALNPGNSGGALVNLKGELVGINTAILSPSGAFAGNSFAVPSLIVQKVVKDIIEYGEVQRAILGVSIEDITAEFARANDIKNIKGVYVAEVRADGAASKSGVKQGDIILAINDVEVNSAAEIQAVISRYRPKDVVKVKIERKGNIKEIDITLTNIYGSNDIVKKSDAEILYGAEFRELSAEMKKTLGIRNGVSIVRLNDGKFKEAGIREGFIVQIINDKPVANLSEIKNIFASLSGGVYIQGVYPSGVVAYYAFGL